MEFGREVRKEELAFKDECYKIGMKNGWCSGRFDRQEGNFLVEEDRLNKNSFIVIDDLPNLKAFFKNGNWCLGQGVIYKNLCFIQQVNGGDEWLTIKQFPTGTKPFESFSWEAIIEEGEFEENMEGLLKVNSKKEWFSE